ncbi:hypothetical protein B0A55_13652 [Friedmanniomyces simplex]|uniref:Sulfotransferase domain-containing protein n=1 Tax=Friedmanniomyces simplex TaxID=329884 RepID=A0A4U0WQ06_9PEZI|nr:hypothetical protein B0A55_13652 [Friedmanniomyces simplex]
MATQADFDRIGNYARMYNNDQNIDRRKCNRVVPMEVICPGYSRTGTLSMRKALEILGFSEPYHFSSFYDNLQDCDMWLQLMNAKYEGKGTYGKEDFDKLLGHCGAVTDMPCHLFAEELIEWYPEAKVVLVERNIDSWFRSWSAFLNDAMSPAFPILAKLDPSFLGRIAGVGIAGVDKQVGSGKTVAAAKARSKEMYRKHYAFVRSVTPKERLLDFSLADGWGPLCEFLGKPMPTVPFPHENETARNKKGFEELALKSIKRILTNAALGMTFLAVPVFALYGLRN